ncbi:MAG: hypothetical protein ACT4P1_17050 [Sporichthyaceae bacterium]
MHAPTRRPAAPPRRVLHLLAASTLLSSTLVGLALAPPAQAAAASAVSLTYGTGPFNVGQGNVILTVSFTNTNTAPDQNSPQTIDDIVITPSCAAVTAAVCTTPDPGVFNLGDEARASGAGCPTGKFFLGAPDPTTGAVRATRLAPEAIPAGGSCTLRITARVVKLPTDSDPVTPGLQTIPVASATTRVPGIPPSVVTSRGVGAPATIAKATPLLTTAATGTSTGGTIRDVATVSGRAAPVAGATVTFRLYPPSDVSCSGTPTATSVRALSPDADTVTSDSVRVTTAGTWRWVATYSGDANNNAVTGVCGDGSENSTVTSSTCFGEIATLVGSDGDDTLTGTSGRDIIVARSGNDTINGAGGDDLICGGGEDDVLFGGGGSDFLLGGKGSDQLRGGTGDDELSGGRGSDDLFGASGDDLLSGGPGGDQLDGGSGVDEGDGGPGSDSFSRVELRRR